MGALWAQKRWIMSNLLGRFIQDTYDLDASYEITNPSSVARKVEEKLGTREDFKKY